MAVDVSDIRRLIATPVEIPATFESRYDREADVLYVTFERAVEDDSVFTPENLVLRYREGRLLSITVLNASRKLPASQLG